MVTSDTSPLSQPDVLPIFEIMEGNDKKLGKGSIPELLSDALGVTFDHRVGHDYFQQYEERHDYYNKT